MASYKDIVDLMTDRREETPDIAEFRKTTLNKLMVVTAVIGLPAVSLGAVQSYIQGRWPFSVTYVSIYLLFLLLAAMSRKFSYGIRALTMVSTLFAVALAILIRIGMSGVGLQIMLGVCFLAALFFGLRAGMIAVLISVVSISVVSFGFTTGFIPIYPEQMLTSTSPLQWLTALCVFFMIASFIIIVPQMINRLSAESIALLSNHRRELEAKNRDLLQEIGERKWAEAAMRESEKKYRTVVENIVDVFARSDGKGHLLMASASATGMFGYDSVDEMIGLPLASLWQDAGEQQKMLARVKADGRVNDFEAVLKKKDGTPFDASLSVHFYYDDHGTILGTEAVIRDITERKRAEKALREGEERYRELVENMSDVLFAVDAEGVFTYVSPVSEALTGYPPDALIGRVWREFTLPQYRAHLDRMFLDMLGGTQRAVEFMILKKSGQPIWVRASARPMRRKDRIAGIQGILTDITEHKHAEQQLETKAGELAVLNSLGRQMGADLSVESAVKTALEHTVQALDADLTMLFLKEGEALILKATLPESGIIAANHIPVHRVGMCLCGLVAAEEKGVYATDIHTDPRCTCEECRQAGVRSFAAFPLVSGNETIGVLALASFKERDFEKQAPLVEALGNEIAIGLKNAVLFEKAQSDAIELQTRLRQIEQAEQEKESLTKQLYQAQKMEAIGTLAGGIAHDFNNILTPVIMGTEMALMSIPAGNSAHPYLQKVLNAGMRAKDLVQQILTFSRQSDLEKGNMKLVPILKETIKLARASLPSTIEIRQDIRADRDLILGNPTQVHQVMMNLFTNAAHAMRDNGGIMEIVLREEDLPESVTLGLTELTPGRFLRLSVRDTGNGMDKKTVEQIFDPFFTTKERGEGTGLGLSIVHGIVKSSGGAIVVESEPGHGTTFTIYIPTIDVEGEEEKAEAKPLPRGTESILLVDDEPIIVEMYRELLTTLGYRVNGNTSATEALETFRADPQGYDLVITDMTMPRMTGAVLASEILHIRDDLPIILCTGFSEQITEAGARELGIKDFVIKPIDLADMAQKIRTLLDERAAMA